MWATELNDAAKDEKICSLLLQVRGGQLMIKQLIIVSVGAVGVTVKVIDVDEVPVKNQGMFKEPSQEWQRVSYRSISEKNGKYILEALTNIGV